VLIISTSLTTASAAVTSAISASATTATCTATAAAATSATQPGLWRGAIFASGGYCCMQKRQREGRTIWRGRNSGYGDDFRLSPRSRGTLPVEVA